MYLNSFNYFRGIAIVFIVAGHCFYMSGWVVDTLFEKFVANLVLGGTSFFVFISGFLFHHIFYSRFNYRKFMLGKMKNVLSPYLVMSLPLVLYCVVIKGSGPFPEYFFVPGDGFFGEYVRPIAGYLWTGRIQEAYWYIPFIMIMFAASPLIMLYIRLRTLSRLLILAVLLAVSLFIQRPVLNISVLQSVIYFTPVYLFGIVISMHREAIYARLHDREWWLLAGAVLLAILQAWLYDTFGNLHKPPLLPGPPDLLLLQKLLLCLFFMVFLNRFEKVTVSSLETLAAGSFAIYFIHPYLLWWLQIFVLDRGYKILPGIEGPLFWLLLTPAAILLSMGIALLVRRTNSSFSRALIGW